MHDIATRCMQGVLLLGLCSSAAAGAVPEVAYWDNWTDASGVSHLTRCQLQNFSLHSVSKPATPEWQDRQPEPARSILTNVEPPGWVGGWHENPAVQWIIPVQGVWSVQAMDGSEATLTPGDLMIGEDQGSRPDAAGHSGHLSRNAGPSPVSLMIVQLEASPRTDRPCRFR